MSDSIEQRASAAIVRSILYLALQGSGQDPKQASPGMLHIKVVMASSASLLSNLSDGDACMRYIADHGDMRNLYYTTTGGI